MSGWGILSGFVGGAAKEVNEIAGNEIRQRDSREQLLQQMALKYQWADAEDKRAMRQRTDRASEISGRIDANLEAEQAQRYADPELGATPLTPEQLAVQEQGLKAQRIAKEREKLAAQRNPRRMIEAAVQTGHADPAALAQLDSREALAAQKADDADRHMAIRTELAMARMDAEGRAADRNKAPAGYRHTVEGNLEAIPGGPADQKQQGQFNADTAAMTSSFASFDRLAAETNKLLNHPGLKGITGVRGKLPNLPGGDAADAQALLDTIKSQVAFGVLQDMRNNSKTGGALGAVSDSEGKRLEANLAALDRAQSLDQFKASLQQIITYTDGAKDRMRESFNMRHQGSPSSSTNGPSAARGAPVVRSREDLAALPSGTIFTAPDGSLRRKP